ncbi:hypothetical protein KDD17_04985 [Sulfitobacter albidus]|uniref:SAP domain-containing protein n=1 Tax=Sulfitobacter albidus TaxID=2829501 RepID=A0A975PN38_9RHOB|nr:DUF6434 domain-containing protein [Sulfitobacter albidus]QUJ77359.1 hypothetical protein KDD17_04985 [Sulfitobacter albidus]
METRPDIHEVTTGAELRRWYWLRAELADALRDRGLPVSGNKHVLLDRLATFLDTGDVLRPKPRAQRSDFDWHSAPLDPTTVITDSYRNTQNVRRFFRDHAGAGFKFNIAFMTWMRENTGRTLADAVEAYHAIRADGARTRSTIAPDNQFNKYTRDFLDDNPTLGMAEVRKYWALKRARPSEDGRHTYDPSDLDLG